MGNYVISCCSTADLSKDHFDAIDVKYICFHFELDGKQYEDNLGVSIPFDEFYSRMANGADTKTSQVNAEEFEEYFRSFLEQGLDILHVSHLESVVLSIRQILRRRRYRRSSRIVRSMLLIPWRHLRDTVC